MNRWRAAACTPFTFRIPSRPRECPADLRFLPIWREFFGIPVDIRLIFMNVINDPEKLPEVMAQFEPSKQKPKK